VIEIDRFDVLIYDGKAMMVGGKRRDERQGKGMLAHLPMSSNACSRRQNEISNFGLMRTILAMHSPIRGTIKAMAAPGYR